MRAQRETWQALTREQRRALWPLVDLYLCDEVRSWTPEALRQGEEITTALETKPTGAVEGTLSIG